MRRRASSAESGVAASRGRPPHAAPGCAGLCRAEPPWCAAMRDVALWPKRNDRSSHRAEHGCGFSRMSRSGRFITIGRISRNQANRRIVSMETPAMSANQSRITQGVGEFRPIKAPVYHEDKPWTADLGRVSGLSRGHSGPSRSCQIGTAAPPLRDGVEKARNFFETNCFATARSSEEWGAGRFRGLSDRICNVADTLRRTWLIFCGVAMGCNACRCRNGSMCHDGFGRFCNETGS